jgi:hypothetical protein
MRQSPVIGDRTGGGAAGTRARPRATAFLTFRSAISRRDLQIISARPRTQPIATMALILLDGRTMRSPILIPIFSTLLLACGTTPDDEEPTTIQLTSGGATALVAFRDGTDGAWQPATMKTATSYEFQVHGPYIVAVACDYDGVSGVAQIGRTLDEPHDLGTMCPKSSGSHKVTGVMAQAGKMVFGKHFELSTDPAWEFQFFVDDGAYDLLALTDDRIEVRRQVAINADQVLAGVDVVQQGMPLAQVAFSAANAAAGETLRASVLLGTADSAQAEVYAGPIAAAKVAPEAALVAADRQTVSLQATTVAAGTVTGRAVRRPFRVGGDAAYTLPSPLSGVQWAVESNQLVVSWTSRPDNDYLVAFASGTSADGRLFTSNELDLSAAFLAATKIKRATFAADVPGYKPAWLVDLTREHSRELDFQNVTSGVTTTIWTTEEHGSAAAARAAMPGAAGALR